MDEALNRIYAAFNPNKAATEEYYVDCGEARGQTALAKRFRNHLAGSADSPENYLAFLFTGHLGCGKSSELRHLYSEVKKSQPYHLSLPKSFAFARIGLASALFTQFRDLAR